MIEFYSFSWLGHIVIISILGISSLTQTTAFLLSFFRYGLDRNQIYKKFFEVLIIFEIIIFALLYGQMLNGYRKGFLLPTGYTNIRIITFLIISILGLVVYILKKDLFMASLIPAFSTTLPIMESFLGRAYPLFFIGALIFLIIRSIKICISSIRGIKTSITSFSVPHALDILHTGVLISENNGQVILTNHQMNNLMLALTGKIFRNSIEFYDALHSDKYECRYKKTELEGETVYHLKGGSAWVFIKTDILLEMKNYIHISATDVRAFWTLTIKLQEQEKELEEKSTELKRTIDNLHVIANKKEIDNMKMRAHDILGQRLSILLRIIQNESNMDYDLLKSLSKGLLAELKLENNEIRPYIELEKIQEIFKNIGISVKFKGDLPQAKKQACLFIDIIRESCTNAVRHALATEINIISLVKEDEYKLIINNNGRRPILPITPGNGIKTMRKNISAQGGNFDIKNYPKFTLFIVLPGGEEYEKSTYSR